MAEVGTGQGKVVKFKTDINLYEKARPEYSKESVEFILNQLGALNDTSKTLTILELGAGTGKFTRVMVDVLKARSSVRIIASDPQASMCEKFKEVVPDIEILNLKAEDIKLPDASVDLVVSAQAFHWFANSEALTEIHRVLVPRGKIGAIWNTRNRWDFKWVAMIEDVIAPYRKKYGYLGSFEICIKPINESNLFTLVEVNTDMRNKLGPMTADDLLDLYKTISAIHKCTTEEKTVVATEIRDVLDNHLDGKKRQTGFILPYKVQMLWCTKV